MLVFVTAYSPLDSEKYRAQYARCVQPGLDLQPKPFETLIVDAEKGLAHAYEAARKVIVDRGYSGAVFLHADLEIMDPLFTEKVERAFADPDVAVAGLIGSAGFMDIAWWNAPRKVGRMHHGPECDIQPGVYFPEREGDVDAVDGCIVALSPWARANLAFDPEGFPAFHGWELDICTAARDAGRKVRVIDSEARHHTKGGFGDKAAWDEANRNYRLKWGRWLLGRRS